jgi:uncharacterized membrane protein (DUF373 family)
MLDLVRKLEHGVTMVLIVLLGAIVALATLEVGFTIAKDVVEPPIFFPGIDRLLDIFGKVLLVVLGIELLETLRAFASEGRVRAEIVLTVAVIALARKIILIEPEHASAVVLFGDAALLAALAVAYRFFSRQADR